MEALIVLGIIAVIVIWFATNWDMTLACPSDGSPMQKSEDSRYTCNKCGLEKYL